MFACSIKHLKVFKAEALLPMPSHKRPHELSDILLKNWLSYSTQLLLLLTQITVDPDQQGRPYYRSGFRCQAFVFREEKEAVQLPDTVHLVKRVAVSVVAHITVGIFFVNLLFLIFEIIIAHRSFMQRLILSTQ